MIRSGVAVRGDDLPRQRPKPALHAIADDRRTDFLRNGEADPFLRVAIVPVADQKDKAGRRRALAGVGGQEVRTFAEVG